LSVEREAKPTATMTLTASYTRLLLFRSIAAARSGSVSLSMVSVQAPARRAADAGSCTGLDSTKSVRVETDIFPACSSRSASDMAVDRRLCFGMEDSWARGATVGDVAAEGSCPGDGATTRVVFAAIPQVGHRGLPRKCGRLLQDSAGSLHGSVAENKWNWLPDLFLVRPPTLPRRDFFGSCRRATKETKQIRKRAPSAVQSLGRAGDLIFWPPVLAGRQCWTVFSANKHKNYTIEI
jgi:hypothetical protein